ARGWLQIIDDPALARIRAELQEGRFLGPLHPLPPVGTVDFTHAGLQAIHPGPRKPSRHVAFHVARIKATQYYRSRTAALKGIEELKAWDRGTFVLTGPKAVGPWRAQWWRRFPCGYRLDVEARDECPGCPIGQGCYLERSAEPCDLKRLQHVLACHNVALAEWLVCSALERGSSRAEYLAWSAARAAAERFGF